jgi:hypothetical protein
MPVGVLGHRPLVACTVDGDGVRREAVEVRESPGVEVRDQGRLREGGGGRDRRPRAPLLSEVNAPAKEFAVNIHWNESAKTKG